MENTFRRAIGLVALVVGMAVLIIVPNFDTTDYGPFHAVQSIGLLHALTAIWLLVEVITLIGMVINKRPLGAFALGVYVVLVFMVWVTDLPRLPDSPTDTFVGLVALGWPVINILDIAVLAND